MAILLTDVLESITAEGVVARAEQIGGLGDFIKSSSVAMVFKGTLGTNGTIQSLPTITDEIVGNTYLVSTAGTYDSLVAKQGDMITCTESRKWELIPICASMSWETF